MSDVLTPEQRRKCMAAVKGKNTTPEMLVRKFLFSKGLRFRVNVKRLPGSPDIVLRKYRTVVFVDGCFWHKHEGCRFFHLPKTNTKFWEHKVNLNYARDYRVNVELKLLGWRVVRVWECSLRDKKMCQATLDAIYNEIICSSKPYAGLEEGAQTVAAEDTAEYSGS